MNSLVMIYNCVKCINYDVIVDVYLAMLCYLCMYAGLACPSYSAGSYSAGSYSDGSYSDEGVASHSDVIIHYNYGQITTIT